MLLFAFLSLLLPVSLQQQQHDQFVGKTFINVDLARTHPISDKLYGIFFEEVVRETP